MPEGSRKEHSLTVAEDNKLAFSKIVVAIDFGGTGSGHALVAAGITEGYDFTQKLVALKSRRYLEGKPDPDTGEILMDIDPVKLGEIFVSFCEDVIAKYGFISKTYGDSAEQVLIRGLKSAMSRVGLGYIKPQNSCKALINDRIFCMESLTAQGRFYYVEDECQSLLDAISTAVWDSKHMTDNVRLDDGTSDIDSLDAFEYCFERDINKLVPKRGGD